MKFARLICSPKLGQLRSVTHITVDKLNPACPSYTFIYNTIFPEVFDTQGHAEFLVSTAWSPVLEQGGFFCAGFNLCSIGV